jgi:hypothetical protein
MVVFAARALGLVATAVGVARWSLTGPDGHVATVWYNSRTSAFHVMTRYGMRFGATPEEALRGLISDLKHGAKMAPKFPLGRVVITPGAADAIDASGDSVSTFVDRHASGDWGGVSENDRAQNDAAAASGGRVQSSYATTHGVKLWVITEHDRSVTTVLLPEEY